MLMNSKLTSLFQKLFCFCHFYFLLATVCLLRISHVWSVPPHVNTSRSENSCPYTTIRLEWSRFTQQKGASLISIIMAPFISEKNVKKKINHFNFRFISGRHSILNVESLNKHYMCLKISSIYIFKKSLYVWNHELHPVRVRPSCTWIFHSPLKKRVLNTDVLYNVQTNPKWNFCMVFVFERVFCIVVWCIFQSVFLLRLQ